MCHLVLLEESEDDEAAAEQAGGIDAGKPNLDDIDGMTTDSE